MARSFLFIGIAFAILILFLPVTAWDYTIRASVASNGTQGNSLSNNPSISGNGRFIAFDSSATNLVPVDSNERSDIFTYNLISRWTSLISVSSGGVQGNDKSYDPSISSSGILVAFESDATNLVTDTNGYRDIFVRDWGSAQTTRVSEATGGYPANGNSYDPAISGDGRYVAFASDATNLVTLDTNSASDIFVHDRQTGNTIRVSVGPGGVQSNGGSYHPSISGDGRYVAFDSTATNLVMIDSNSVSDIFVYDRNTGTTTRASVADGGTQASGGGSYNPSLSADGNYVAFDSSATDLVTGDTNTGSDVFAHDLTAIKTIRVSVASDGTQGDLWSYQPSISGEGRYVAFESGATNLVTTDTNARQDIFVRDLLNPGLTTRVSVYTDGYQATDDSKMPAISSDGQCVAFESIATDLVPGDTNGFRDIFAHYNAISHRAVFRSSAYDNWIFTDDFFTVKYRDHYGLSTDKPLVGDFNDDGVMDRAVFRNGNWIMDYSMDGSVDSNTPFGMAGDVPLVGYFNRDQYTDRAVFRNGQWIIDYSMDGTVNSRTNFGMAGDVPMACDVNGDGIADRAVFRNGQWIVDLNMDGTVDSRTSYGMSTDLPLMEWLDNGATMDRAAFRNGEWIMDYDMDGLVDFRPRFGTAGDKPLSWVEI